MSLRSPIGRRYKIMKRAVSCAFRRASLTVEAAFVIPIFIMAVVCISSMMNMYSATLDKMASLRDSAQIAASAAGFADEETWIVLTDYADYRIFFLPSSAKAADIRCVGAARAWTGRDGAYEGGADSLTYVYVAENGSVYHTSSACTHIDLSIHTALASEVGDLRNGSGGRYTACEICLKDEAESGDVLYITNEGDRYHGSLACSGLKRTVRMVEISKISGLRECSRCASAT